MQAILVLCRWDTSMRFTVYLLRNSFIVERISPVQCPALVRHCTSCLGERGGVLFIHQETTLFEAVQVCIMSLWSDHLFLMVEWISIYVESDEYPTQPQPMSTTKSLIKTVMLTAGWKDNCTDLSYNRKRETTGVLKEWEHRGRSPLDLRTLDCQWFGWLLAWFLKFPPGISFSCQFRTFISRLALKSLFFCAL